MKTLKIIPSEVFPKYKKQQPITVLKHFNKLKNIGKNYNYGYFISASSVYSSMIEGNTIDFDTYLKYAESGMNLNTKDFKDIKNLENAYEFAKKRVLNFNNFLEAHKLLSENFLDDKYSGKIRDKDVYIFSDGKKIYTGASKKIVWFETNKLFDDINTLRKTKLNSDEVFFYASMIHLIIAKIHPFADGNGRIARLCEKWFLADKLGNNAWYIMSEKLYKQRIKSYYKNIHIGRTYETLNFNASIPFLKMLPMALKIK